MANVHRNDKVMDKRSLTSAALKAVASGLSHTRMVAEEMGIETKAAHAFLRINSDRGNLKRKPYAYGGATRIKWVMTARGWRKLRQSGQIN